MEVFRLIKPRFSASTVSYTHLSLATIHPRGRELSLEVGANVIMPNVSPQEFRAYYTIYPDKLYSSEPLAIARQELEDLIVGVGRTVGQDLGHSPKPAFQNRNA